jgi:hypothetical protein
MYLKNVQNFVKIGVGSFPVPASPVRTNPGYGFRTLVVFSEIGTAFDLDKQRRGFSIPYSMEYPRIGFFIAKGQTVVVFHVRRVATIPFARIRVCTCKMFRIWYIQYGT